MIKVKITDSIRKQADEHARERIKYEYNRFKLSQDKRISMILIGSIGQIAFKKILDDYELEYKFQFQAGQYDNYDFKIADDIVEIKTSGCNGSFDKLNLLYADDQYNQGISKNYVYCVQQFIDGYDISTKLLNLDNCSACFCVGFIPFSEIKNFPNFRKFFGDDYKVPLTELKSIELLLSRYKKYK